MESAVTMGRAALEALGDSQQDIDGAEDMYRKTDIERLDVQRETGDYRAAQGMVIRQQERPANARAAPAGGPPGTLGDTLEEQDIG